MLQGDAPEKTEVPLFVGQAGGQIDQRTEQLATVSIEMARDGTHALFVVGILEPHQLERDQLAPRVAGLLQVVRVDQKGIDDVRILRDQLYQLGELHRFQSSSAIIDLP